MLRCGLLGEKLGHSYSPEIHKMLAGYEYRLYERRAEELESFIRGGEWDGLNVNMPYKKAVRQREHAGAPRGWQHLRRQHGHVRL